MLDDLDNFFDVVNVFDDFFHLFHDGDSLNDPFDFNHLGSDISNRDNLLLLYFDFSHFFNDSRHFNNFLYQFLNILVDFDHLGNDSFYFNDFWNFYQFLDYLFNFVNSGYDCGFLNDFFYDLLGSNDFLHFGLDCYNFFNNGRHLLYDFLDVGDNFLDFLDSFVDNNFLNDFLDLLNPDGLLFGFNDFLDELGYLDDLF